MWARARSAALAVSSSPDELLLRAGASPPHSLSSGAISTVPSPSQLSSTGVAPSSFPSMASPSPVSLLALLLDSVLESMGPGDSGSAASAICSPALTGASVCSSPKASRSARSSERSRNGFSSSICSTSCAISSVESCSRRIDCCSWGVSARCWETRSDRPCFMRQAGKTNGHRPRGRIAQRRGSQPGSASMRHTGAPCITS
ncbi:hypothetical protein D9M69_522290 [compost metagenome]